MTDLPDLEAPWSRIPLVHDETNLLPEPTVGAMATEITARVVASPELSASIASATGGRPTGITGAHSGLWDARASLYNAEPSRLRKSRGRLLESRIPGKRLVKILCIGDSITAGEGATSPRNLAAWPAAFRDALLADGYRMAGDGWVQPNAFEQTATTRPTQWVRTSGTWGWFATGGQLATFLESNTPLSVLTFTSSLPGDTLEFSWLRNNQSFSYSVDGGEWVPVTAEAQLTYKTLTISGLNPAVAHSVAFRVPTGFVGSPMRFGPARVYNVADKGVLIANAGVGGSSSTTWRSDTSSFHNGPTTLALNGDVDLVILEPMMFNDINGSLGVATHKANILSIITSYKSLASAPDVLLVIPARPGPTFGGAAQYDAYRTASYEIADTLGLPLVDLGERFGTFAAANADGYYFDALHMTTAGYGDMGRAIASALMAT